MCAVNRGQLRRKEDLVVIGNARGHYPWYTTSSEGGRGDDQDDSTGKLGDTRVVVKGQPRRFHGETGEILPVVHHGQ